MRRLLLWSSVLALPAIAAGLALAFVSARLASRSLDAGLQRTGDEIVIPDPEAGFVRPPDATTSVSWQSEGIAYTIHTDSRGLRAARPGEPARDEVAILTIGGSFTVGHGLEYEDTYPAKLGALLDVPVGNAALSSYGSVSALKSLARHSDLRPRVVIYGLIAEHGRRNLDPCAPSFQPPCLPVPHVTRGDDGSLRIEKPDPVTSARAFAFASRLQAVRAHPTLLGRLGLGLDALRHNALRLMGSRATASGDVTPDQSLVFALRRMKRRTDHMGAKLIVLVLPIMDAPHAGRLAERLRPQLAKSVEIVDFAAHVRERTQEGELPLLMLSRNDHHPNAIAHEMIARLLARTIERERLL